MKPTLSINAPLSERLYVNPDSVTTEQIIDSLKAYESILDAIDGSALDTCIDVTDDPSEVANEINKTTERLTSAAIESMVDNPYKDFFDDCVGALQRYWPAASIEDEGLKAAILAAIERGDTD